MLYLIMLMNDITYGQYSKDGNGLGAFLQYCRIGPGYDQNWYQTLQKRIAGLREEEQLSIFETRTQYQKSKANATMNRRFDSGPNINWQLGLMEPSTS